MKKLYISALAALMFGATACNDILDVEPSSQYSDEAIWNNENTADYYIMASYQLFNDWSQFQNLTHHYYDAFSDLYKSTIWDAGDQIYNKMFILNDRLLKNSASAFDCWGTAYGRIKRANLLLNSLEQYGSKFGEEWQTIREAEIRYCRAINYFNMARVYGGLVKRTDHSGANGLTDDGAVEADCNRARMSEEETYQFILDELQWAADHLPEKWVGDTKDGRATKGIVYGYMSRIALYAQQWQVAADAAEKCKQYGNYSLVADYAQLFNYKMSAANRKEVIDAMYYKTDLKTHSFDSNMSCPSVAETYGMAKTAHIVPTAELADCFEFRDGTPFSWTTWDKNNTTTIAKKLDDPFTEREPRFHATLLYNGATWGGKTIETFVGATSKVEDGVDHFVEFENASSTKGYTPTGYYIRKFLMEGYTEFYVKQSTNTEILLRYAEVLLNKAEALAMLGKISEALVPLNEVRARVGLPARTAANLDEFMEILRKERICELAGEGHRYWDLIRWQLAKEVIDGKAWHGVRVSKSSTGKFSYKTVECDGGRTRTFQDRYYRLSLPAAELTNNKLCVDNPGW